MVTLHLILLLVAPCVTSYNCYDSYSCSLQSLATGNNSDINCFGYFSCAQTTIISTDATFTGTSNASVSIGCHGSFSCYKSNIIQINNDQYQDGLMETNLTALLLTTPSIRCHGLFSCASVTQINNYMGRLLCDAESACSSSTIYNYNSGYNIEMYSLGINTSTSGCYVDCAGTRSCADSIIYTNGTVVVLSGHLAAQNTIFYDSTFNTSGFVSRFYFYGANSGDGATIICNNSVNNIPCDIEIECHSNGCNNLTLICGNNNFNSIQECGFKLDCNFGQSIGVCINSKNSFVDWSDDIQLMSWTEFSSVESSQDECSTVINGNAISCNDFGYASLICQENKTVTQILSNSNDIDTVCCSASKSCDSVPNITFFEREDNRVLLRCDGGSSCARIEEIIARNVGNQNNSKNSFLFMSGAQSGTNVNRIDITLENIVQLICSGGGSCGGIDSISIDNNSTSNGATIYCGGSSSCSDISSIDGNFNIENIVLYGKSAGESSTFNNILGSVYCGTTSACKNSVMQNIGDSVLGSGFQSVKGAIINHVNNNVFCFGEESCKNSRIEGVSNKILMQGDNSAAGSTIISGNMNSTLIIRLNGTNDDLPFDIYCNQTDICKIDCQSSDACSLLRLHCSVEVFSTSVVSNCFVNCDESLDFDCPLMFDENSVYSEWDITTTTIATTALQTNMTRVATTDGNLKNKNSNDRSESYGIVGWIIVIGVSIILLGVIVHLQNRIEKDESRKKKANKDKENVDKEIENEQKTELLETVNQDNSKVALSHQLSPLSQPASGFGSVISGVISATSSGVNSGNTTVVLDDDTLTVSKITGDLRDDDDINGGYTDINQTIKMKQEKEEEFQIGISNQPPIKPKSLAGDTHTNSHKSVGL